MTIILSLYDANIPLPMNILETYAASPALSVSESVRLAQLLSLPMPKKFNEITLAHQVAEGLPTRSVTALADLLGRAHVIGPVVPEATLRRLKKSLKPLPRKHSERIYELGRVIDALAQAYHGDATRIDGFLYRPHPLLDGETPFEMARSSSAGAHAVLNLVRRAVAGVVV